LSKPSIPSWQKPQRCGHKSFDDFKEISQFGGDRLRQEIITSNGKTSINSRYTFSGLGRSMPSGLSSVLSSLRIGAGKSKTRELPLHQVRPSETQLGPRLSQPATLPESNDEHIYLLLCYNQGRYAVVSLGPIEPAAEIRPRSFQNPLCPLQGY
jgi:hypothetical protein